MRNPVIKTALLIDGENIFYGARDLNAHFNYCAFLGFVYSNYRPVYATYYTVRYLSNGQKEFLKYLKRISGKILGTEIEIRKIYPKVYHNGKTVSYACSNCGYRGKQEMNKRDGDMDVYIATDAFKLAYKRLVDRILLVTGDRHLVPVIRLLSDEFKIPTDVMAFEHNLAPELKKVASSFIPLTSKFTKVRKEVADSATPKEVK